METDKLKAIAEHSGTSISTVRRVLGHCAGIAPETREAVIGAQCTLNHPTACTDRRIYFILPDNPKFFWHKALDVLNGHPFDPPIKLSFYPSLQQHSLLKTYLEPLLTEENAVLILAADPDEGEQQLIAQIAKRSLVIQLCQYTPIEGTVYVGADAYADGYALGQMATQHLGSPRTAVLKGEHSYTQEESCRGFIDGLGSPATVLPEPDEGPLYASLVARTLAPLGDLDLVFCPGGRTAELCRGLYKLRNQATIRCIGYEASPQLRKMPEKPLVFALLQQDIASQTRTVLSLAKDYLITGVRPASSTYYIPSRIGGGCKYG